MIWQYSRFRIASLTKQTTATAIMQLVQSGSLSLNDLPFQLLGATGKFAPISGKAVNPNLSKITIRHLLEVRNIYTTE